MCVHVMGMEEETCVYVCDWDGGGDVCVCVCDGDESKYDLRADRLAANSSCIHFQEYPITRVYMYSVQVRIYLYSVPQCVYIG